MKYTFKNGITVPIKEFELDTEGRELFKVNLPGSLGDYDTGNGEGVWAQAHPDFNLENFTVHEDSYEVIFVRIDNSSLYYPGLTKGMYVPVELRNHKYRPVGCYSELIHKYGPSQKDKVFEEYLKHLKEGK